MIVARQLKSYTVVLAFAIRHGPFDIRGGGGWDILEKNFLALILTKKK